MLVRIARFFWVAYASRESGKIHEPHVPLMNGRYSWAARNSSHTSSLGQAVPHNPANFRGSLKPLRINVFIGSLTKIIAFDAAKARTVRPLTEPVTRSLRSHQARRIWWTGLALCVTFHFEEVVTLEDVKKAVRALHVTTDSSSLCLMTYSSKMWDRKKKLQNVSLPEWVER